MIKCTYGNKKIMLHKLKKESDEFGDFYWCPKFKDCMWMCDGIIYDEGSLFVLFEKIEKEFLKWKILEKGLGVKNLMVFLKEEE